MVRKIVLLLTIILVFLAGIWIASYYHYKNTLPPAVKSSLLLEQINKVCKLVTVEGQFIEYYDYNEPDPPLFLGPIPNYRALLPKKAARLRIRAKVLVGYDMKDIKIESFPDEKRIVLYNLPNPDIIAIEHEIDRFDNEASIFRPLESEDYVKIDQGAQDKIRELAMTSSLVDSARQQGNDMLELIRFIVENAGWTIELKNTDSLVPSEPPIQ
ncbi:MAG: DUF4230 domain-containing protein [Bacteroidota bacterium]